MGDLSPHFDSREFRCHHSGVGGPCPAADDRPDPRLVDLLEAMRVIVERPMIITSGLRCPAYNRFVGGAEGSEHITGEGADIRASTSFERWALVRAAIRAGCARIGVDGRFVHVGVSTDHPQDCLWLYAPERG